MPFSLPPQSVDLGLVTSNHAYLGKMGLGLMTSNHAYPGKMDLA